MTRIQGNLAAASALVAGLVLAACGGTSTSSATRTSTNASKVTLVSCLSAHGLAIGWYEPEKIDANGNTPPTILPANYDFARGGINDYYVSKGRLPTEGPSGPAEGAPILGVGYLPDAATNQRELKHATSDTHVIGNFNVAGANVPQSEIDAVVACIRKTTHAVNNAGAEREAEAADKRILKAFDAPSNTSTWTESAKAAFLSGCENAGGDTPQTCQCALDSLVKNVDYLDFLSIVKAYRGSGIPQKLSQYMIGCLE